MGEIGLDDLRVLTQHNGPGNPYAQHHIRRISPAEFDRIAREQGYVKQRIAPAFDVLRSVIDALDGGQK